GVVDKIPASTEASQLKYIIRAHGLRPSSSLKGQQRWTRHGINAEDLTAVASELAALAGQTAPRLETQLRGKWESPQKLLRRSHQRLRNSLKNGFPPVLGLRRYVFRNGSWQSLESHFVTIVSVPDKLDRKASSYPFTYFDPWGGKKAQGRIHLPSQPVLADKKGHSTSLQVLAPSAKVGVASVRKGEQSELVPLTLIGRW
ncbi:MAG: hypothetical protein ACQKBU_03880, partial [Verrucomicrobiales bacterium]